MTQNLPAAQQAQMDNRDATGRWHHLVPGETIHGDRFEPLAPR